MKKRLYVMHNGRPIETKIRNYTIEDIPALIDAQRLSFPPPFPEELLWNKEQLREHVTRFPAGALCAEIDGVIAGSMTGLIVDMQKIGHQHDWESVTDGGYIRNHDAQGDTLYVVDICVIPEYRKAGIGKWLMQSMYETVVALSLKRLLGGGRMPGYRSRAQEAAPQQYVDKVISGEWHDPVITFLLRCGRTPIAIAEHYLEDEDSLHHAVLMEWRNPFLS